MMIPIARKDQETGGNHMLPAFRLMLALLMATAFNLAYAVVDLSISPENIALSSSHPTEGDIVQVYVTVDNIGDERVTQNVDIEVWLYEGPPDDEDTLRLQSLNTITGLSPGKSKVIRARWRARAGVDKLYARLDPDNMIPESDETNNQAEVNISVKPLSFPPVTQAEIDEAVRKGAEWIKSQQGDFFRRCPSDGSETPLVMPISLYDRLSLLGLPVEKHPSKAWDPVSGGVGATALAVMSLLAAGVDLQDQAVQDGLQYLVDYDWEKADDVYAYAMLIPALIATGDKKSYLSLVQHAVDSLVRAQLLAEEGFADRDDGGWGYGAVSDGAHMQYVIYALYSALEWEEIKIPSKTWERAIKWVKTTQHKNGGWNYNLTLSPFSEGPYGSMTATGVMALKAAGVSIASENIQNGLSWLEKHYTIASNPGSFSWHHYYLLSLMRALEIPPRQPKIGDHDWYDEIARLLVHTQRPDGRWVDVPVNSQNVPSSGQEEYFPTTCFAVLFLTKFLPKLGKPDFSICSDGIVIEPNVVLEDKPVSIKIIVSNNGKAFEGEIPVGIYDGDPSVGGKLIENLNLVMPKGKDVVSTSIRWKAENPGYHRIFVKLDPQHKLSEITERNNYAFQEMEVKSAKTGRAVPPQIEKISDGVFRIGKLILDTKKRQIEIPGKVNQTAALVEYLACGNLGKLHESVLVLDVEPTHLFLALLRLGLRPGGGVRMKGDPRRPQGDPVKLMISWKTGDTEKRIRAEEAILNVTTGETMQETDWIFTGSIEVNGVFRAQVSKSIIATYRDPEALINNPLPTGADDTVYRANPGVLPEKGTPITLIITPAENN